MTRTNLTATATVLILIGAGAVFFTIRHGDGKPVPAAVESPDHRSGKIVSSAKPSARESAEFPELVEKYGAARVALSREVAQQTIEMMTQLGSPRIADTPDESKPDYLLDTELHLNPRQEEQYYSLLSDFRKRRDEKVEAKDAALREGYGDMMAMLLAADARASGRMSEQDYQNLVEARRNAHLITVPGLPEAASYSAMDDETFAGGLMAVLTPEQQRQLQAANEKRIADKMARKPEVVPPRTLEEVKAEMDGITQSFEGVEKILESMKGELGPAER